MKKIININNLDETNTLGKLIGNKVANNMVVLLRGDLGAGKTTFTKAVLSSLGINDVQSPTFTIVKEYESKYKVYHMDLYRLNNNEIDHEIDDYICSEGIKFIEWPDNQGAIMPEKHLSITISRVDEDKRKFIVEANDEMYDIIGEEIDFFTIKNQFNDGIADQVGEMRESSVETSEERKARREAELEERKAKREAEKQLREEERNKAKALRDERAAIREQDKLKRDEEAQKRKQKHEEIEAKRAADLNEVVTKILELEEKSKELEGLTELEKIELNNLKNLARAMSKF